MTLWEMANGKRHMFCFLFHVVLLTIAVADDKQTANVNVSGSHGVVLISSRTVDFNTRWFDLQVRCRLLVSV